MKLVIEMPEIAYKRLLEEQHLPNRIDLEYFIVHGTPLPKGHWIKTYRGYECSNPECAYDSERKSDFCPNCGADMRDKENEE